MDHTDVKIINILQNDCKTTTREIGKIVGLTAPAVAERINRLKDFGILQGFYAKINPSLLGKNLSAFISINVPPHEYENFCSFAKNNPCIVEHHHIIGSNNALLKIRVSDASELEENLKEIRKFGLSQTSVLLNTYFDNKPFEI